MSIDCIDPLNDQRWAEYVARHPKSSIFHTVAWLKALAKTYGYQAVVYTTATPGEKLGNGVVFCSVRSWLTGSRLVGLPFSDHCEPLVSDDVERAAIFDYLRQTQVEGAWKYIEVRPMSCDSAPLDSFEAASQFYLHKIDLTQSVETLLSNCHKDCVVRKIKRQRREGLRIEEGNSPPLLDSFYALFLRTRRRQEVPPTPRAWFDNLADLMGNDMRVHVCFKDTTPVASIITLRHKLVLTYKYGCSDERFHYLGGMQALFWNAINQAKAAGFHQFDMGRTDLQNQGLAKFKTRWGAVASALTYFRLCRSGLHARTSWLRRLGMVSAHLPDTAFVFAGRMLYKHAG